VALEIALSDEALRDLSNLDAKTAQRILKKLEEAAKNPSSHLTRLKGYDEYKLRVGDYRVLVIFMHQHGSLPERMLVERVGHRKNIYKKK
jgi:mRNA-degrading endonuclease RelE of RelBE toxin-antitoxin system